MWIEVCQILGKVSQSSLYLKEKPPKGCLWSLVRLTKIQATTRPDYLWPEIWSSMSKAAQKKEKQQWAIEKPKLENARNTERRLFHRSGRRRVQGNHQKNASEKLEIQMEATMPCKLRTKKRSNKSRGTDDETKGSNKIQKTKHACIVEAHESNRKRFESTLPKDHEDHIAEKGPNSMSHYNLVHKFVPMPQAMKIPDVKAAVDKGWELPAWQMTKERSKKASFLKHTKTKRKSTSVHVWTFVISKNAELEPKYQKYKGRVVLRSDMVKDDSGSYPVLTEQGSSASQMPAAKIMDVIARQPDCAGQAADAVAACTQVKLEELPDCSKFPNQNVQICGYVFHDTNGQKK